MANGNGNGKWVITALVSVGVAVLIAFLAIVTAHATRINKLEVGYGRVDEKLIQVIKSQDETLRLMRRWTPEK